MANKEQRPIGQDYCTVLLYLPTVIGFVQRLPELQSWLAKFASQPSLNFTMGFHFFCWVMYYAFAVGVDNADVVNWQGKKVSKHCRSSDISESHDGKHSIHLR